MKFTLVANNSLSTKPQTQWIWYSHHTSSFIVGDEVSCFAIPIANPTAVSPINSASQAGATHPYNLPLPATFYIEFIAESWHGFKFLQPSQYDKAVDKSGLPVGDMLRTIVFGPDYGLYVLHPTGAILSLRSGAMELLEESGNGFAVIDKTKTRGRAALAFAAHPQAALICYGDNSGTFHIHRFEKTGFGKAQKFAEKQRKASRLEFVQDGSLLLVGGMGYLSMFQYSDGKYLPTHEISISVRDFLWIDEGKTILVNQGIHGLCCVRYTGSGFSMDGVLKTEFSIQQAAISSCRKFVALTDQESSKVYVYAIDE